MMSTTLRIRDVAFSALSFPCPAPLADRGLPGGGPGGPPFGREEHVPPRLAEHPGEGARRLPALLHPDVGQEVSRADHGPRLRAAEQRRDRDAEAPGQPGGQRREGDGAAGRGTVPSRALWPVQG
jgi:hypothetical protein